MMDTAAVSLSSCHHRLLYRGAGRLSDGHLSSDWQHTPVVSVMRLEGQTHVGRAIEGARDRVRVNNVTFNRSRHTGQAYFAQ
jgi:hypothetical protein